MVRRVAPQAKEELTPLVRSKMVRIDDRRADQWQFKNRHQEEWFINRDFVLTYMTGEPGNGNEVVQGNERGAEELSHRGREF